MITASFLSGLGGSALGTLFVRLTADTTTMMSGLREAELAVASTSDVMLRQAKILAAGMTGAFTVIGAAAVNEFAKFNKAMTESTAIMGNLSDRTKKKMEELALSLSGESIKSSTELAKSYYFLASAGLNAEQTMTALPIAMKFATAGNFEMEKATMLLTSAQAALGLKVNDTTQYMKNMARVADVLVKADILAQGTVEQFSEALTNKAAAALRLANKDIEEGVATLAAFAEQGLRGEAAGDALNIVLRDLQRTALTNQHAFKELGVAVYTSDGAMRNMADIVKDFEEVMGDASVEERRMAFQMMGFHDRSLSALLSLIGFSEKIREYEKALRQAGGTTEDVTEKQLEAFSNQWTITGNQVKNFLIMLGESFAPALSEFNLQLRDVVKWLSDTQKETGALTAIFTTVVDVLKGFGLGLKVIWTGLSSVATIIATYVITDIEILGMAIESVIKISGFWWTAIKGVREGLLELSKSALDVSGVLTALANRDFKRVAIEAAKMLAGGAKGIAEITNSIQGAVNGATKEVSNFARASWNLALGMINSAVSDIRTQWKGVVDFGLKLFPAFSKGPQVMKNALDDATTSAKALNTALVNVASNAKKGGEAIEKMANSLKVGEILKLFGEPPKSSIFTKTEAASMRGVTADQLFESMGIGQQGELTSEKTEKILKAHGLVGGGAGGAGGIGQDLFSNQLVGQSSAVAREIELNQNKLRILEEISKKDIKLNEETQKLKTEAMEKYNKRLQQLHLAQAQILVQSGQNMFDALGQAAEGFAGKQSSVYKAMFAASKAFAIAESVIKIQQGIAEAASLPWPANLAAIASVVAATANIVTAIQSVNLAITEREKGGPVSSGQLYLVGEKGPEIFSPSQSGTIIPNNRLGGGPTKVIVNNFTDARPEVKERNEGGERVIEVMIRRVKNEISSEIRDGRGDVTKSMENSFGLRRGR